MAADWRQHSWSKTSERTNKKGRGPKTQDVPLPCGVKKTIGYGHNLEAQPFFDGKRIPNTITQEMAEQILDRDIADVVWRLKDRLTWFGQLTTNQQSALINMAFQMGVSGLLGFKHMLCCLKEGDIDGACVCAKASAWHSQTPERAKRVIALLKS